MAIADVDGNGTIDLTEFKEFIDKVSEDMDAEALKEIFDSIDVNNDGELTIEEFGSAIFKTLNTTDEEND